MTVYRAIGCDLPSVSRGITLGVFDGVHRGHEALLATLINACHRRNLRPTVLAFMPPPGRAIMSADDKTERLRELGAEEIFLLELTPELRAVDAVDFVGDWLVKRLNAALVVAGEDARFGREARGDAAFLCRYGAAHDLDCCIVPDVEFEGEKVSSSRIRKLLTDGDTAAANALMRRPFRLKGTVESGRGLGKRKGFPTANFTYPSTRLEIAHGVYMTTVTLEDGRICPAITNVGHAPTLDSYTPLRVETHLYDFEQTLYGETVTVDFLAFVRPEQHFASVRDMVSQVKRDLESVRALHATEPYCVKIAPGRKSL